MLKMAMKIKARALESQRKTAVAAAEVAAEAAAVAAALAEPRAPRKKGDAEKPPKKPEQEVPPEKLLSERERRKMEKKLLEQRRKEEKKKEKERKKLEKMQKKKKVPEVQEEARNPEGTAAAAAQGAGVGATSRIWIEWDTDSSDEDDDEGDDDEDVDDDLFDALRGFRGAVWGSGLLRISALSAHLPLLTFLLFSVRSPAWVLDFLLQKRPEQGRGCGFFFGATCCFRMFLGCAFFSFVGGRAKRRGRGRPGASGAFGPGHGARRPGRDERLV